MYVDCERKSLVAQAATSAATSTSVTSCVHIDGAQWLAQYNVITIGDLDTVSDVENRTLVCGSYTGTSSANFGIHRDQNSQEPSLEIQNDISSGSTLNIAAGSVTSASGAANKVSAIQNNLKGRSFNVNGGNQGASAYIDSSLNEKCTKATEDLTNFSQYLSLLTSNNEVIVPTDQSGPLNLIVKNVNADGLAVFSLTCNEALNNPKVQQIEIRNDANAKTVVINLSGRTCSFEQGNMVGSWLNGLDGRSRTLWNVYEAPSNPKTPLMIAHNFMGALLAPYYNVETSANIDGVAVVKSLKARSEIHNPMLQFPSCAESGSEFHRDVP